MSSVIIYNCVPEELGIFVVPRHVLNVEAAALLCRLHGCIVNADGDDTSNDDFVAFLRLLVAIQEFKIPAGNTRSPQRFIEVGEPSQVYVVTFLC